MTLSTRLTFILEQMEIALQYQDLDEEKREELFKMQGSIEEMRDQEFWKEEENW